MKKIIIFFFCCWLYQLSFSQTTPGSINSGVKVKELAVPKAPAFKLLDISPTQIETPNTPKQFVLGIAQSLNDSLGWPRNYSTEFSPYWWLKSSNRSVYDFLGLRIKADSTTGAKKITGENVFSGLKFTSISLAFINQDLIPDSIKQSQKILSIGINATIVKIHSKNYANALASKLQEWHDAAQSELEFALTGQPSDSDTVAYKAYWQRFTDLKPTTTGEIFNDINDIMNEKPLFSLNVSAAYANYGINDSIWKSGRFGGWATVSSYLPLNLDNEDINKNYFALFGYLRYIKDNYAPDIKGKTLKSSCLDIGAKLELQFDKLCIGYETIHRSYSKKGIHSDNRSVGVISYQVGGNLYINGAFGKDFGITNKLISFLGINWGFGDEKIKLE
jgi:hypothetical protein